jgi:small conductance mechanosensitive channel
METTATSQIDAFVRAYLVPFGWKLLGALAVWVIGSVFVRLIRNGSRRVMAARRFDDTLTVYLDTSLGIVLKALLVIAVFGVLGVETTSFAALLAAAGLAIGAAWSGLLANFAAGLFLLFLRPFKVGDVIEAGGITGVVREVGLFTTSVDTGDNVRVSVGNNKIFADSIRNFSVNPYRRIDVTAPIAYGVNPLEVMPRLLTRVGTTLNVLTQPPPSVEILEFRATGAILAVRSYCESDKYLQVRAEVTRVISEVIGDAGYGLRASEIAHAAQWTTERAH